MGGSAVNVTIPAGLRPREGAGDLDFSDLAPGCERTESASWTADGQTLVLPFSPEPTPDQEQLIRRRLLTRDAREERIVSSLVDLYDGLDPAKPLEQTARLLIEDRVGRIEGWS